MAGFISPGCHNSRPSMPAAMTSVWPVMCPASLSEARNTTALAMSSGRAIFGSALVAMTLRIMDASPSTWMVNLDGKKKTVQAAGAEESSNPALKLLREMVQEVTADAFDREGGQE